LWCLTVSFSEHSSLLSRATYPSPPSKRNPPKAPFHAQRSFGRERSSHVRFRRRAAASLAARQQPDRRADRGHGDSGPRDIR
jgi:hypothetical protein